MSDPENILNELEQIAPALMACQNIQVYTVPEAYFNNFPHHFFLNRKASLNVPEGYFEHFADTVLTKIKTTEQISDTGEYDDLLENIGRNMPYFVPDGYFQNFTHSVRVETTQAKVIKPTFGKSILKYAVAAVVAGLVGFFIYMAGDETRNADKRVFAEAQNIIKNKSFDETLAAVSETDIISYLEESGNDVNAALVATIANKEAVLPDADSYLFDDKSLEDFLADFDM